MVQILNQLLSEVSFPYLRRRGGLRSVTNSADANFFLFGGSVTRLGDLLDFGQLFKACGNN